MSDTVQRVEVEDDLTPCTYDFVMGAEGNVYLCRLDEMREKIVGAIEEVRGGHAGNSTR